MRADNSLGVSCFSDGGFGIPSLRGLKRCAKQKTHLFHDWQELSSLEKNSSSLISLVFFCVCPCTGIMSAEAPIPLNLDIRDLQIQTVTVEKLLEPLIIQVGALGVLQCATAVC